jgi:SAM-dependent methyltransferase
MTIDPSWEAVHSAREWGKYPPEELVRFVAWRYYQRQNRQDVRLLDLGCGLGTGVWFFSREGFHAVGIDGSPSAIARLKDRLTREGLTADLHVGDVVTSLPVLFPEASFDAVVDITCLCCLPSAEARRTIEQVARVLKPGGRFLSMLFDVTTWGYGEGREVEPHGFTDVPDGPFKDRGLIRLYAREELEALFAALPIVGVESTTRTMDNGRRTVKHWVVECMKGGG